MALIEGGIYEGWSTDSHQWLKLDSKFRRRVLERVVTEAIPRLWIKHVHTLARAAGGDGAQHDVLEDWLNRYSGAKAADMSEQGIRDKAESYSKQAQGKAFARVLQWQGGAGAALLLTWCELYDFIHARLGWCVYPKGADAAKVEGLVKRVECPSWWRRQLRRMVARKYEGGCFELGLTGAAAGAWYCSDRAVIRRRQQNDANAAMMLATKIQNEAGQVMTLADIAARTVANKAIRRGELMTRIRGCETWADSQGMAGLFTTNTCPSRFHSQRREGGRNPKYQGATPSDAQAWLCKAWARLRAKLARLAIAVMGFRVAEPHHDGCVHWHMLLWCKPEHVEAVKHWMLFYWLQDEGKERGAAKNRVNIKAMLGGQAAGYIAKYIAKNIDDISTTTHTDDQAAAGQSVGPDLLGDTEVKPCHRVEAWAATWSIRQFQAIGQPSVTVWRELRRVDKQAAAGGSDTLIKAWLSVHREGDKKADWSRYMQAQGGAMQKRKDYRLCVHSIEKEKRGRYGVVRAAWACGVQDKTSKGGAVPTKRVQWGAEGFALQRVAVPWTRLNNCTPVTKTLTQKMVDVMTESKYLSEFWSTDSRPCVINGMGRRVNRFPLGKNAAEWALHNGKMVLGLESQALKERL